MTKSNLTGRNLSVHWVYYQDQADKDVPYKTSVQHW